ncbi:TMEM165/GDT1 family protein [Leptolyngbya sp. BC1307]|uniref:TMEM165/GDT1 family protein n=1 Tax=Leptolyngbya sp. BC1307 TaxID=2029589 RepID=UPI000EFC24FB|nr:TMEM165/GDT1 family protein [Leptolyngbya sp. BC1307]
MVSSSDSASSRTSEDPLAADEPDELTESAIQPPSVFWSVFLSTFVTIFLAELGDKTQVTILLMSAGSQSPLTVFVGAGLALIATSLVGVLLGRWLAKRVSSDTLDTCAGILLLLITIGLIGDIVGQ